MAAFKFWKNLSYHNSSRLRGWGDRRTGLTASAAPALVPPAAWRDGMYFVPNVANRRIYTCYVYDSVGNNWYTSRTGDLHTKSIAPADPGIRALNALRAVAKLDPRMLSQSATQTLNHWDNVRQARVSSHSIAKIMLNIKKNRKETV